MAKKSQVVEAHIQLQHGFTAVIPSEKKWLDVNRLKKMLTVREHDLRTSLGSQAYEKLKQFCAQCLIDGNHEMLVTVVGKGGDMGMVSYQCLFRCDDARESFVLRDSFFSDFGQLKTKTQASAMSSTPA